ncbi:sugar transferase [Synechococcus sp. PCC 7336]|uniref:sugar transferase n=1 Tax=Synechococcus sp. PCC 7336 TaxID=195250 RepID=UPI0003495F36|nr:sugar transferase [Synechococcus sp. PCC 7336]
MKPISSPKLARDSPIAAISSRSGRQTPQICWNVAGIHPAASSGLKRTLDLIGSSVGLLLTSILFVPIAIAIKLDSPGPILFSQRRCGLQGKPFRLWKFRSMVRDAEGLKHLVKNEAEGHIFKSKCDPRTTRIGRFLRRTSLDELPQFWNVWRGEMSLIGTRPPTLEEVSQYEPHHFLRLRVKPGITGEWQVYGRSQVRDFEDIVALDLRYQQRWSIGYDLNLLLKTFWIVLQQKGAC